MRILSLALAAVLALGVLSAPRPASAAPNGSYRESCRNLRVDGPILYAECQARFGWRSSRLDYKRCYGDIANENGYLVCRSGGGRWSDNDWDDDGDRWNGDGRYDNDWNDRGGWNDRGRGGLVLFSGPGFSGGALPIYRDVWNLDGTRFNDRAQSVRVDGGVWLLCEHANFGGRCVTVGRSEPNLWRLGLGGQVSSVRRIR